MYAVQIVARSFNSPALARLNAGLWLRPTILGETRSESGILERLALNQRAHLGDHVVGSNPTRPAFTFRH